MKRLTRNLAAAAMLSTALVTLPLAQYIFPIAPSAAAVVATPVKPNPLPGSFATLVARHKSAVVTVLVKSTSQAAEDGTLNSPFPKFGDNDEFNDFLRRFFGGRPGFADPNGENQTTPREIVHGLGSGFVIDPSGLIVTNNHVVDSATEIRVKLDDGTELAATLVGKDAKTDLALIKVKPDHPLPALNWGDSDRLAVGDWVVAIGNPFGLGGTVTAGIVSARGRDLHSGPYDDFIQVDAAINKGNSGGPLFDMNGNVVGVNAAIYSPNGGSVGVGFAIPSAIARTIVAKLASDHRIDRGFVGVSIQPVTTDIAEGLGLKTADGALISEVMPNSAAAAAGFKTGDVVKDFAGHKIADARDLSRVVADIAPGRVVSATVLRDGKSQTVLITLGRMETDRQAAAEAPGQSDRGTSGSIGLALSDITPDIGRQLQLPAGTSGALVTSVDPEKPAAEAGIQTGDVVVSVGKVTVNSARQAVAEIAKAEQAGHKKVLLLVQHAGHRSYVAVETGQG